MTEWRDNRREMNYICIVYTLRLCMCVYTTKLSTTIPSFGHGGQSPFTSTEDCCRQAAGNGGCHQDTSKAPNISIYDNTGAHERMVSVITAWTGEDRCGDRLIMLWLLSLSFHDQQLNTAIIQYIPQQSLKSKAIKSERKKGGCRWAS